MILNKILITLVLNSYALPAPATSPAPPAPINVTPAYFGSILNAPFLLPNLHTIPIGPVHPALPFLQPPSPQSPLNLLLPPPQNLVALNSPVPSAP